MRLRGVTGRMMGASALLVVVVAAAFAVLLSAIGDLRDSTRWTEHSVFVLGASDELQNDVGNLTTATRNYVANPDPAGLRSWRAARARLPMAAGRLRQRHATATHPSEGIAGNVLARDWSIRSTDWRAPEPRRHAATTSARRR